MTNAFEIDRREGLSKKEFYNSYVKKSLPVVLTDKGEWVSSDKFSTDYLKSHYNH